jgi:hypothetical protein
MSDKEKKDMNKSAKDGGADTDSQLAKVKSNEEKKNEPPQEFINTSSKLQDPASDLHNIPGS